jgi:amidase
LLSTADCFQGQIRSPETAVSSIDRRFVNPATGPVYVTGAAPGDTLAVDILELAPGPWGLTVAVPGMGLLGKYVKTERTHLVEVNSDGIQLGRVKIPYRPMLGVIGVAPAQGAISTVSPGDHGGNLDCTLIRQGSTVFLPVAVPGALFAAGDMHAAMGDGEISGTGIEVPGTALLRLRVLHDFPVMTPWIETGDTVAVVAAGATLEDASRTATLAAVNRIADQLRLDFADAYALAGACLRLRICQVVNPFPTVRAEIPKWLFGVGTGPDGR